MQGLHLLVGLAIFGLYVFALAWQLEVETAADTEPGSGAASSDEPSIAASSGPENVDQCTRSSLERVEGTRLASRVFAYYRLMKPRLMWLLCLVAAAAMALAAGRDLTARVIVLTLGGGVLAIGASGTFNHVLERNRDRRMSRTSDRPLVTQEVPARNAVAFGVLLTGLSIAAFLQVNVLAALLGLGAILFYSVVYTLVLKPNTVQSTVLGGAAGSLPALIGWAAATGRIGIGGLVLAGLIFVWTLAHFYNLALAYREDYARGGFPMMPVVRGPTTTRKHIVLWLGATLATATGLLWLTDLGWLSAAATAALGAVFLYTVVRLHRERSEQAALRAFHASNAYLGGVLLVVVLDTLVV